MISKSSWLLSAGLFALATPALAQPTSQSNTDTDKQTTQPTPGATEGAATQDQARQQQPVDTADIIITATRRNQALSDVPMAVSAVTAQQLRFTGATDIRQLNQVSPSLLVSSTTSEAGGAVARIRGIGTVGDNPGLEGSVGVFIDGVYRARRNGPHRPGAAGPDRGAARSSGHTFRPQHVRRPHLRDHREAALYAGSERAA